MWHVRAYFCNDRCVTFASRAALNKSRMDASNLLAANTTREDVIRAGYRGWFLAFWAEWAKILPSLRYQEEYMPATGGGILLPSLIPRSALLGRNQCPKVLESTGQPLPRVAGRRRPLSNTRRYFTKSSARRGADEHGRHTWATTTTIHC